MNNITTDELRCMNNSEALILQGCGGELTEWVDGINEELTDNEILLDGTKFKHDNVSTFKNDNVTCLLFPMDDSVKLDVGKLAMWRISTHECFGGTWLSDYVPNRLGGFESENAEITSEQREKPDCPLIGQDGNIFNLMGVASRTLKENNMRDEAKEMQERITSSGSYEEALGIIGEYVNITSVDDMDESNEDLNLE